MQKPLSSTSFSRSVLGVRATEKENNSINSNTNGPNSKAFNLIKYKKQTSQITTYTENMTNDTSFQDVTLQRINRQNKSFIQSSGNMKLNAINKSQEIAKEFKKSFGAEKIKKNNKVERPIGNLLTKENKKVQNNFSFINAPTNKQTTANINYENFIKKAQKEQSFVQREEKNKNISNLFPSILENLQLSNSSPSILCDNSNLIYSETENAKLAKFYAKDIMEILISKDVSSNENILF